MAFISSSAVGIMADRDSGGAARRRARRLRMHWHHEQLTLQMVQARVEHHSYGAPRRQQPPGPGRRSTRTSTKRHGDRSPPFPSRCSSSCLSTKSPAVPGHPVWVSRWVHRSGSSSAPWNSSPTSCPWYRFWTLLCHRWWTSGWLRSCTSTSRFPSRLSQCPRICVHPVVFAWFSGSRRRRSSWWKCRLSCLRPHSCSSLLSRTLTFQFLAHVVIMEVFKVFSQNMFRSCVLWSRSSTILLVVVFKIFVQSPFSHRMEKCAQPMLQLSVLVCAARTWFEITSTWFTWLAVVMMAGQC